MSGWDFLEGRNKRIGARVIENAKLRQPEPPPPDLGLEIALPHTSTRNKVLAGLGAQQLQPHHLL
eukprot:5625739-Prymnesium_polylepis.1